MTTEPRMTYHLLPALGDLPSGNFATSLAGANRYCAMPRANAIGFKRYLKQPM